MKKKLLLLLLFLGVFLLCGCEAKIDSKFTINKDKSMNIEMLLGFDDEFLDYMMSDSEDELDAGELEEYSDAERLNYIKKSIQEDKEELEENIAKGFSYKEFQDDKYTGYRVSKNVNNIDELIGNPDFNLNELTDIDSKKIFEKNGSVYKAKIEVGEIEDTNSDEDNLELGQMGSLNFITYTFTLNLPNKAISSNATAISEDGKTLTWDLSKGSIETIEFEFEFPTLFTYLKDNMLLTAGVAVVVVLGIVALITMFLKKDKNISDTPVLDILNTNANEPVMNKNDVSMTNQINQPDITNNNDLLGQTQNANNQFMNQTNMFNPNISQNNIEKPISQVNESLQNINQVLPTNEVNQVDSTVTQDNIANVLNSIPVVQSNNSVINNSQNITNNNQNSNPLPEIKPVMPEHINMPSSSQQQLNNLDQNNTNINN